MSKEKHWDVNGDYVSDVTNSVTLFSRVQATDQEMQITAAAPDLLEACQRARNQFCAAGYDPKAGSMNPTECLLAQLIAAISKATGE